MLSDIETVSKILEESSNIVFFGGAGVSTESGIPDFRSDDGIYNQEYEYPPEQIVSRSFFLNNPEAFYDFFRKKSLTYILNSKPNTAHKKLAEWENEGKLKAVVTQNIDGLHQRAGSKNVLELHGSLNNNYCVECGKIYDLEYIESSSGVARCSCGGIIHPGAVLFEEALDQEVLKKSIQYIADADVLIVAGTSGVVYPAAGLIEYYTNDKMILINKNPNIDEKSADYLLIGKVGEIFEKL